jgi:hypothetical protein
MTIVSSKEFATNQEMYFDLAVIDEVFIERDDDLFHLMRTTADNMDGYDEVLEPDEDFRRAITMDELRERTHEFIHKLFANK